MPRFADQQNQFPQEAGFIYTCTKHYLHNNVTRKKITCEAV